MIVSEYSEFYPISFGYLHPEMQSYKKEEMKNKVVQFAAFLQYSSNGRVNSSMHTHSLECWKVDHFGFHLI